MLVADLSNIIGYGRRQANQPIPIDHHTRPRFAHKDSFVVFWHDDAHIAAKMPPMRGDAFATIKEFDPLCVNPGRERVAHEVGRH